MNWKRFRKKPVVVEAIQWDPDTMKWSDFPAKYQVGGGHFRTSGIMGQWMNTGELKVSTLEGVVVAQPNDWIVRGVQDEMYPVRDDIFRATYEEVE